MRVFVTATALLCAALAAATCTSASLSPEAKEGLLQRLREGGAAGRRALSELRDLSATLLTGEVEELDGAADVQVLASCGAPSSSSSSSSSPSPSYHRETLRQIVLPMAGGIRCELLDSNFAAAQKHQAAEWGSKRSAPVHGFLLRGTNSSSLADSLGRASGCAFALAPSPCVHVDAAPMQFLSRVGGYYRLFDSAAQRSAFCRHLVAAIAADHSPEAPARVMTDKELQRAMLQQDDGVFASALRSSLAARGEGDWSTGGKKILAFMVSFSDNPGAPMNAAETKAVVENVGSYFEANSYGKTSFSQVSVFPEVVTVDAGAYSCTQPDVLREHVVAEGAKMSGYDTKDYNLDVIFFKNRNCGGWAGLAAVGGKSNWLNWVDEHRETYTYAVAAHEFGHNYGLSHAGNKPTASRGQQEYGDNLDCMGNCGFGSGGSGVTEHFNVGYKKQLGWLGEDDVYEIDPSRGISPKKFRLFTQDQKDALSAGRVSVQIKGLGHYLVGQLRANNVWEVNHGMSLNEFTNLAGRSSLVDIDGSTPHQHDSELPVGATYEMPILSGVRVAIQGGAESDLAGGNSVVASSTLKITVDAVGTKEEGNAVPFLDVALERAPLDEESINAAEFACVQVTIVAKEYGEEKFWRIVDGSGQGVNCEGYGVESEKTNNFVCALEAGQYEFLAADGYGDGWEGATFSLKHADSGESLVAEGTVGPGRGWQSTSFVVSGGNTACKIAGQADFSSIDGGEDLGRRGVIGSGIAEALAALGAVIGLALVTLLTIYVAKRRRKHLHQSMVDDGDVETGKRGGWVGLAKLFGRRGGDGDGGGGGGEEEEGTSWQQHYTPEGEVYFYNPNSNKTRWSKPRHSHKSLRREDSIGAWVSYTDTETGDPYYYCTKSGAVSWNKPCLPENLKKKKMKKKKKKTTTTSTYVESDWSEYKAEDGTTYFLHVPSGVTQWDDPRVVALPSPSV